MSNWTLFSNHGHVLVCLAGDSEARLRDVAADVGITERAVQKIVRDLQNHGMISVTKHGRRNRYRIHHKKTLRHALEAHCTLGELLKLIAHGKPEKVKIKIDRIVDPQQILSESKATKTIDVEPVKVSTPDHVERQQGSLFQFDLEVE